MIITEPEFNYMFKEILNNEGIAKIPELTADIFEKLISYLKHLRLLDDKYDMKVDCSDYEDQDFEPESAESKSASFGVDPAEVNLAIDDNADATENTAEKRKELLSFLLHRAKEQRENGTPVIPRVKKRKLAPGAPTTRNAAYEVIIFFLFFKITIFI